MTTTTATPEPDTKPDAVVEAKPETRMNQNGGGLLSNAVAVITAAAALFGMIVSSVNGAAEIIALKREVGNLREDFKDWRKDVREDIRDALGQKK